MAPRVQKPSLLEHEHPITYKPMFPRAASALSSHLYGRWEEAGVIPRGILPLLAKNCVLDRMRRVGVWGASRLQGDQLTTAEKTQGSGLGEWWGGERGN